MRVAMVLHALAPSGRKSYIEIGRYILRIPGQVLYECPSR